MDGWNSRLLLGQKAYFQGLSNVRVSGSVFFITKVTNDFVKPHQKRRVSPYQRHHQLFAVKLYRPGLFWSN